MTNTTTSRSRRRRAAVALLSLLVAGTVACGASGKTGTNDAPGATTGGSGSSTETTAPQSGGAGF